MQFTAKYAGYNLIVRDVERQYFPDGRSREVRPMLVADFGEQGELETYDGTELGESSFTTVRAGGFLDTERAQKENRWTDEDRELVEERLLEIAGNGPRASEYRTMLPHQRPAGFGDVLLYEEPKPVAPFQNYDNLSAEKIVRIASELGVEEAALAYEQRQEEPREKVVGPLTELIEMKQAEADLTAA